MRSIFRERNAETLWFSLVAQFRNTQVTIILHIIFNLIQI